MSRFRRVSTPSTHKGGLGDIQLPTVIAPPTGNWILGAGPAFLFPTATDDAFGRRQWGSVRPWSWATGQRRRSSGRLASTTSGSDRPATASPVSATRATSTCSTSLSLNLPNAWQVGFSPTITYDARASSGNQWNVPVGLMVSKTTRVGMLPVKFNFGVEYSVVSQDAYGDERQVVLEVIPVIPALIRRSILGRD